MGIINCTRDNIQNRQGIKYNKDELYNSINNGDNYATTI